MLFFLTTVAYGQNQGDQGQVDHEIEFYKEYHALVVGIGAYENWPPRPQAIKNADEVSKIFRQVGFSVKQLTNPSFEELRSALAAFAKQTGSAANQGLIFYYSGHSQTSQSFDGSQLGWIIPKDAPLLENNQPELTNKAINTNDIAAMAGQIKSKYTLFIFDVAFSASLFKADEIRLNITGLKEDLPARRFITAGRADEPNSKFNAFHQFLLEGLKGEADLIYDGAISSAELGLYLTERVTKVTGGMLHPQFGQILANAGSGGDFIFPRNDQIGKLAHLFVETQPASAATQILDIKPPFTQGMALKPGKYRLKVSADGHKDVQTVVNLDAGEERTVKVELPKAKAEIINSLGMRFVRIRPGKFQMGSPPSEPGRSMDETLHKVSITHPFFMQQNEVTVSHFKQFVTTTGYITEAEQAGGCWITNTGKGWALEPGTNWKKPGAIEIDADMPAMCIAWNDADAFTRWLSEKEGRVYRLPSEAQWEYAARAKIPTPFSTGNCLSTDEANFRNCGHAYKKCTTVCREERGRPIQVGQLAPNRWQLYNIHGNVAEWCQDWYGPYSSKQVTNPTGPSSGSERVMRGGHWQADAAGSRSAVRRRFPPGFASDVLGFRLVLIP